MESTGAMIGIVGGLLAILAVFTKGFYNIIIAKVEKMIAKQIHQYELANREIRAERQKAYQERIAQIQADLAKVGVGVEKVLEVINSYGKTLVEHEVRLDNIEKKQ